MTTGKFVKELPWTEDMKNVPLDKYNFIWKKYSQHGYRTMSSVQGSSLTNFPVVMGTMLTKVLSATLL
jgi:hypothetical protein